MKSISFLLTFSLVLLSVPLGAFSPNQSGVGLKPIKPVSKLATSNSTEDLQALAMVRGQAGEQGNGEGAVLVTPRQKFLTVFLTDPEGEFKQSNAVKLILVGPSGKPCVSSPAPAGNPIADAQIKAYLSKVQKVAGPENVKDPGQTLDRLEAAIKSSPMPKSMEANITANRIKAQSLRNFAVVANHDKTSNMSVAMVINPTPGTWRLRVSGGDREGFYACLAAGESGKSLLETRELWSKAIQGFSSKEDEVHGPALTIGSVPESALVNKFVCALCKVDVALVIGMMAFMTVGLVIGLLPETAGADVVLCLLIVAVVSGLLAGGYSLFTLTPKQICHKLHQC